MNLLLEPSFEDVTPWTLGDHAVQNAGSARTGSFGILLPARTGPVTAWNPFVLQTVTVDPASTYDLSVYVRHAAGTGTVSIGVTENGTYTELASITADAYDGLWELLSIAHAPTDASSTFEVHATGAVLWDIDDAAYEPHVTGGVHMPRGCRDAYVALFNQLKTIGGTGYYHDITGRQSVIARRCYPGDPGAPQTPYLCVPAVGVGSFPMVEQGAVQVTFNVPVIVVAKERATASEAVGSTSEDLMLWVDDIVRCVMSDDEGPWDLGDEAHVDDVTLVGVRYQAESVDGVPPHAEVTLGLSVTFARADLGPLA